MIDLVGFARSFMPRKKASAVFFFLLFDEAILVLSSQCNITVPSGSLGKLRKIERMTKRYRKSQAENGGKGLFMVDLSRPPRGKRFLSGAEAGSNRFHCLCFYDGRLGEGSQAV